MSGKFLTVAIAAFWLTMNVLLWRAEFGSGRQTIADVPLDTVMERVLTAADPSTLRFRHHREELGILRWMPSVIEAAPSTNELTPEGMIQTVGGYHIDVDLNLSGESPDRRWRLLGQIDLSTNRTWREFHLRLIQRPVAWEITAKEGDDQVTVRFEDGRTAHFEQRFPARDLRQLPALFGSYLHLLPGGLSPESLPLDNPHPGGLAWQARNDLMTIGRHRVRVFRVSAQLLQRYEITAFFSRAGELLRVNLPDHYSLVSESLASVR